MSVKLLLGAALTCIGALGFNAPVSAQQRVESVAGDASSVKARELATNRALLNALLTRRAEVARSTGTPAGKRAALDFLDSRIAQLHRLLGT